MTDKEIVFVLGGPGSGKGTQALSIARDYGIGYVSTGDLLRAATDESGAPDDPGGDSRAQLRDTVRAGGLAPDETVLALLEAALARSDNPRFLVGGFPRTVAQAEDFEARVAVPVAVVFLSVPDAELAARSLSRGRAGDSAEAIERRLQAYHDQSDPVIDYYVPQAKVITIDGAAGVDAVRAEVLFELRKLWDIPARAGEPEAAGAPAEQGAPAGGAQSKCCLLL